MTDAVALQLKDSIDRLTAAITGGSNAVHYGDAIGLRAQSVNRALCADPGIPGPDPAGNPGPTVAANREKIGPWETFTVEKARP